MKPADFNQYGTRRGNHEVMMRGTFANIRLKNQMVPGVEGGVTVHFPSRQRMSIYDAAMRYKNDKVPLVIFAGKEYGSGSSRDWAAKGPNLLGVRAVITQSFERIHRSNLIGMGVLPLCFEEGTSWQSLGLKGDEQVTIRGLHGEIKPRQRMMAEIVASDGGLKRIPLFAASIPSTSSTISSTAASCTMSCGSWWRPSAVDFDVPIVLAASSLRNFNIQKSH